MITTKFWFKLDPKGERAWVGLDSRPEHIKQVAEGSLKRLKVDAIDLFYKHRVDPDVPIEDMGAVVSSNTFCPSRAKSDMVNIERDAAAGL